MKSKYLLFSDGTSPHTLKWVKELSQHFELYLVSLNGMNKSLLEYIDEDKIYVLTESVKTSGGNFKLLLKYFEIKKIVDEISPLYVNAHYLSSYGVLAALLKKSNRTIKLIQSTWGSDVLVTPFEGKLKFYMAKFALSCADVISSDSYFMTDKINEIYKNCYTMTFPFGLEKFDKDEDIEKDKDLIFSNRMLSENYNIDSIIKWFSKQSSNYRLVIAHNGVMRDELERLVETLNLETKVSFVGFLNIEEQAYFYRTAKYYISIPTSDSTAVSLLEAMRYGCYPIVSNLSANREWILDNVNGKFFDENYVLEKQIKYDVININQEMILQKAIFENSIRLYVERLQSI